ncbi:MAG: [Desulfovibrionaceae bacterium]|nr:[FeFe] hydrogenase H-cluster maturation GTPase HydF [Desulfovibrionaceae bacterium]
MSLNSTPSSERTHIAFFGLRNAGKSALVNAIASQNLSIVSEIPGTTTDPVQKAMEILPLGPVLLIDTPGLDDDGELGKLRVEKARDTLSHTDIAVIVRAVDSTLNEFQEKLINDLVLELKAKDIPYINVRTKSDLLETNALSDTFNDEKNDNLNILVSAKLGTNITQLKNTLATILQEHEKQKPLVRDLIPNNGFVVLVIPIDSAAPKGRIILPQQQVLRDLLEAHALTMVVDLAELQQVFQIKKPDLVITDSQIFAEVDKITPSNIHLTSFSILMARYKIEA